MWEQSLTERSRRLAQDEEKHERSDKQKREKGLAADIVLVYDVQEGEKYKEKHEARADVILALRRAGLRVIKSQAYGLGEKIYLKISADLKRLEIEAQRQGIEMLVDPEVAEQENEHEPTKRKKKRSGGVAWVCTKISELIFGVTSDRVYRDFSLNDRDAFDRKGNKEGRLFSPLERSRLLYTLIEGSNDSNVRGAELDLDLLVSKGILSTFFTLHTGGQKKLALSWGAMAEIGCLKNKVEEPDASNPDPRNDSRKRIRLAANDTMCVLLWFLLITFYGIFTFGMVFETQSNADLTMGITFISLIVIAALLGMLIQPLDDVRDYFGEKIAFYFGWMEHYSRYMFFLSGAAFAIVLIEASTPTSATSDAHAYAALAYCLVVALWTTIFQEGWKRKTAVLAHTWDVQDFMEEEDPRPEFIANYTRGRLRHRGSSAAKAAEKKKKDDGANYPSHDVEERSAIERFSSSSIDHLHKARKHITEHICECLCLKGEMVERKGFYTADCR